MTLHSFVDESKHRAYILAAAMIRPGNLSHARRTLGELVLPGQRRIHFQKEHDSRRSHIMHRLLGLGIEVVIYQAIERKPRWHARDACMRALVQDQLKRGTTRLVIESDQTLVESDRRILFEEVGAAAAIDQLSYEHLRAHEERLLAIPDAMAWCWAKGGRWRSMAKEAVVATYDISS